MLKSNIIRYVGTPVEYPVYANMATFFRNIDAVAKVLIEKLGDRDLGLVCRGSSGMCIATALAQRCLSWHVIYVRKENETTHTGMDVHADRYEYCKVPKEMHLVFVDDLIASGDTLIYCAKAIKKEYERNIETVLLMNKANAICEEVKDRFKENNLKMPIRLISRLEYE